MNVSGSIYISKTLATRIGLQDQDEIRVRVGGRITRSKLVIQNLKGRSYMLSPGLAHELLVKKHRRLKLRYDQQTNMIHLGPTIGVLSSSLPNREGFDPTSVQAELIYLSNIGKKLPGQVYIFTPSSINWSNNTVRGYVYRQLSIERGMWVSQIYPLPDVVYDRIPSRSSEAQTNIRNTKQRLCKMPYLKYFNPSFLNKWKVYQLLITDSRLYPYIPETQHLTEVSLEAMLKKHDTLYLKPADGSLGKGIIKVRRDEKGILHLVAHRKGRHRSQAQNASDLWKKTKVFRGDRSYIVQQGIKLATFHGSPFDIRIIFQKNSKGEWQVGKKFVRVAAKGSSVANLSSGGRVETTKRVFRILYKNPATIEEKNTHIKELCKNIANTLEHSSQSNYGELGIDIGMDQNGFPWLIEVNSKPRKTTESEHSQVIARNTLKRPLEYAAY
ncbi:MAG: YheC/YheD family protein, partial [Syntrophomonadaceae bacterium]|nr:YheC/YheD family protein [Syntrophomonadaceae bacterium]